MNKTQTQKQTNEQPRSPKGEQPLKFSWDEVCQMRAMYQAGKSVAEIAHEFAMNPLYLRQVLHGESRATEDSHARNRAPIVSPQNYPEEFLRSPDGQLWKRRRRGPGRFKPVIPFTVVCQVRHERAMNGTPVLTLAVKYRISPSYLKEILAGRKRVNA